MNSDSSTKRSWFSVDPFPFPQTEQKALDRSALISRIRKIEIVTRKKVNEQLAGQYQAVFKGRGMSFDEVRPYQPGDEIRFIDWNVTARSNDPFVKRFTEERELNVMLLVDASASMRLGSRAQLKRDVAGELAALLAFSAIKNNDRVGLAMFSDKVEHTVTPKRGKKHVLRLVSDVLSFESERRDTNLRAALEWMTRTGKRKSICFVISDFMQPIPQWEQAFRIVSRRHDLIPIVVRDPMEKTLPNLGLILTQDLETGAMLWVDSGSKRFQRAHAKAVTAKEEELRAFFRRHKTAAIEVETGGSYAKALTQFFALRSK